MTDYILDVVDVSLSFGGLHALEGINLQVKGGELHGVIGPNGAGKTSTLDVITGVYAPSQGSVALGEVDISRWSPQRRARAGVGRSFQTVGLAPGLTARDNVLSTIEALEGAKTPFPRRTTMRRRRDEADELLAFFGLDDVADVQVTQLPLGITKLLEVAKVFAGDPKIVLLDEPFAGLTTGEAIPRVKRISERSRASGVGVLIIEHDVALLMTACEFITVLDSGRVVAAGLPTVVMSDPAVREAYLGEQVGEIVT